MVWTAPPEKRLQIPLTPKEKRRLEELQRRSDELKAADMARQRALEEQRYLAEVGKRAIHQEQEHHRQRALSMMAAGQAAAERQALEEAHERKRRMAEEKILAEAAHKARLEQDMRREALAEMTHAELLVLQKEREKRQALAHLQAVSARNSPYTTPLHTPYSPLVNSFTPVLPSQTVPTNAYHYSPLFVDHQYPSSLSQGSPPLFYSRGHSRSKSASYLPVPGTPGVRMDHTGHLLPNGAGHHRGHSLGSPRLFPSGGSPRMLPSGGSPLMPDSQMPHKRSSAGLGFGTPGGLDANALAEALLAEREGRGRERAVSFAEESVYHTGLNTPRSYTSGSATPFS